ncbi:uncharacterized protein [Anoplolepis gracilipes]|uniref:uncharacterized protein isoform X2 n=1 Tax=Anoplolepis gracilipes TaxID=354296 RepID=UPI003B9F1CE0
MMPRGALYLLLTILTLDGSQCDTRYFVKMRTNASEMFKTKADNLRILQDPIAITPNSLYDNAGNEHQVEDERMTKEISDDQYNRRNSFVDTSTFNPDVLNKFLEDYANKIKSTTEKSFKYPFRIIKPPAEPLVLEIDNETTETTTTREQNDKFDQNSNATLTDNDSLSEALNDTLKRNKYYGTNTYEDRNGWVTLEAIPWSKSKISKWQANPSTQRPWPEIKPWDKPSMKPWASDYTIRPTYENNKPWYDKSKPNWPDNNENSYQKPISRPPYPFDDMAQKWPVEKPYWNKHENNRPNSDIITDNRPANFPNAWSRPQTAYQLIDKYTEKDQSGDGSEWHDYPSKYEQDRPRPSLITERPNFSHYQYVNNHPPNHPASGDGQWILLSTNRGYSKSRQRSIKIDTVNIPETFKESNMTTRANINKQNRPALLPVMTSKRQIDGVAIDQRYEHDDVPRRPSGSREDVQERRTESQGVRDGETHDRGEYPEQKTDQAHFERTTVKFGSSSSRRSRYVAGDNGNDDTDDAGPSKERFETDGDSGLEQVLQSPNESARSR